MREPDAVEPGDARAESALQQAFAHADGLVDTAGIDTSLIRRRATTRSRLKIGGAALAVLLIAGGVATGAQVLHDPTPAADQQGLNPPPPPPDGWRYEYYLNIRLEVPDNWRYDFDPQSQWCVNVDGLPTKPYVNPAVGDVFQTAAGCPSPDDPDGPFTNAPPTEYWVNHINLSPGLEESKVTQVDDWWTLRESVGAAGITLFVDDLALGERILASAVVVTDSSGPCSPQSVLQDDQPRRPDPAFDVDDIDHVDSISVCQYDTREAAEAIPDGPGLVATRTLTGDEANAELVELKKAPVKVVGERPEGKCYNGDHDTAIEVLLRDGDHVYTMYVEIHRCVSSGFDDGTQLRELVHTACLPLSGAPIDMSHGSRIASNECVDPDG